MNEEDIRMQKMQEDLDLLKSQFLDIQKEAKPSVLSRILAQVNKNIPVVIALTSVLAGVWGLVLPVKNYFEERQKRLHYDLSSQMITLANDLRNDSVPAVRQDAVLMLNYYDLNSMPILLYQLENYSHSPNELYMVNQVIKSISIIYMRNEEAVTTEIINYFTIVFKLTISDNTLDKMKYNSLLNYGELINKIAFRSKDNKRILRFIDRMTAEMDLNEDLKSQMSGFAMLLDKFKSHTILQNDGL